MLDQAEHLDPKDLRDLKVLPAYQGLLEILDHQVKLDLQVSRDLLVIEDRLVLLGVQDQ